MSEAPGAVGGEGGAPAQPSLPQPSSPGAPAPSRTPQQASDALDARIAERRVRAEAEDRTRGPDGRFLSPGPQNPATEAQAAERAAQPQVEDPAATEAPTPDVIPPEVAEHLEKATARVTELEARDAEWEGVGARALARIQSLSARIAQLEQALQERGGSVDPRDVEIARLRESDSLYRMEQERARAQSEQRAQQEQLAQRTQARAALTKSTRAALDKHPDLEQPENRRHLVRALQLIFNGGDPAEMISMVAAAVPSRPAARLPPPRTFAASAQAGGGGPRLKDPRDIADKWKARLSAS